MGVGSVLRFFTRSKYCRLAITEHRVVITLRQPVAAFIFLDRQQRELRPLFVTRRAPGFFIPSPSRSAIGRCRTG
jgi:hypothetical protein